MSKEPSALSALWTRPPVEPTPDIVAPLVAEPPPMVGIAPSKSRPVITVGMQVMLTDGDASKNPVDWLGSVEVGIVVHVTDTYLLLETFDGSPQIEYFKDWDHFWVLKPAVTHP